MARRLGGATVVLGILVLIAVTVVGLLLASPAPPDRAAELDARLRCPTCRSVSIAESPSPTASAMRRAVAERVAGGRSDEQILAYFRARYGDWVVLDPPARGTTLALWVVPGVVAVLGAALVGARARRTVDVDELSDADRERVDGAARAMPHRADDEDEP